MTRIARLAALAAVAALPIPSLAQTNVTMYGIADVGIGWADPDAAGTTGAFRVDSSISTTSRWGIRGTEDLGGGMSAFFNAEAQWGLDEGTGDPAAGNGLTFARRSVVGLQGGFGQLYFGREYTPAFYAAIATDLMGYGFNGTTLSWNVDGILPIRYSNGIFYNTPNWGGLQIRAAYGKGTQVGTEYYNASRKRDSNADVAVLYNSGPFLANVFYRYGYSNVATAVPPVPAQFDPPAIRQYGGGLGYKFGIFRTVAGVAISNPEDTGTVRDKVLAYNLGVGIRAGAGEVMIQGHEVRYKNELTGDKPKAQTLGIAYTYPLSKRTMLYATWGKTWKDAAATLALRNNSNAYGGGVTPVSTSPQAFALGMRHTF